MNFPYIKVIDFPKHNKRERYLPWLRFGVFNPIDKKNVIFPLGLVDSGSNVTIIDYEIGESLGFDIQKVTKGFKGKVYGVGGGSIDVYFHKVGFVIDNKLGEKPIVFTDYAGFTYRHFPMSMPQQTAILGHMGFFNHLEVCFKHPQLITIKPLKT